MLEINDIVLKAIIDNNFNIVISAWTSGMAWWATISIFSAALIHRMHETKQTFIDKGLKIPVGIFVAFCFLAMMCFSLVVVHDLSLLETSLYDVFINNCATFDIPNVSYIFSLVMKLYLIITFTMVVFLFVWLYVWFYNKPLDKP